MTKLTYTMEVEKPRLEIVYDYIESPRQYINIGYFYTKESKYKSPDGNDSQIYEIMLESEQYVNSTEEHIEHMTKLINKETSEKVIAIYPVYRYEHGNILYKRGVANGFDYSNCGFYIVTDKTLKEYGEHAKSIESLIDGELEIYTQWVNGEVYGYKLHDNKGNIIDACGGFYGLDDIKEYLGKEWKNENLFDYIVY